MTRTSDNNKKGVSNQIGAPRKPLDTGKNTHEQALLDFLKDSNTCVVNGRLNPENDNYIYFTSRGSSVVDYVIVPHVSLSDCVSSCRTGPYNMTGLLVQAICGYTLNKLQPF